MIITYFRSSSLANIEFCEMQYFLGYCLGYSQKPRLNAVRGTISHKIMEMLARKKKAIQDGFTKVIDDELGEFSLDELDNIDRLADLAFEHYKPLMSHKPMVDKDLRDIKGWIQKALTYSNCNFDPRNQTIVNCEQAFDFTLDREWAKYDYVFNGERITGNLAIKGTIDLIVKHRDDVYEIIDYKLGQKKNWKDGSLKTYEQLQKDIQLRLYHYAVYNLFKHLESVFATIYYVNSGGCYTVCFDKAQSEETEQILKEKFEYIRDNQLPEMLDKWHRADPCKWFCEFAKRKLPGTNKNMCMHIHSELKNKGIDYVMENYLRDGHRPDFYRKPGSSDG